ncbi:hypothetical protein [Fibrisoma montanum]|nr:hypothetical protein [Fibrisoma montanum]
MEKHIVIVIEKGADDTELGATMEAPGFFYATVGANEEEITNNMRMLLADFLKHEGKDMAEWQGVTAEQVTFNFEYDVAVLFEVFDAIKINSIAKLAGINQALMRQYASGVKNPSKQQAKKIEAAIRQLGERLMQITVA